MVTTFKSNLFSIMFMLSLSFSVTSAIENCFWASDLTFVHDREDFSGNFTVVKEYQLKKGTVCEFLINTKTKMTW